MPKHQSFSKNVFFFEWTNGNSSHHMTPTCKNESRKPCKPLMSSEPLSRCSNRVTDHCFDAEKRWSAEWSAVFTHDKSLKSRISRQRNPWNQGFQGRNSWPVLMLPRNPWIQGFQGKYAVSPIYRSMALKSLKSRISRQEFLAGFNAS